VLNWRLTVVLLLAVSVLAIAQAPPAAFTYVFPIFIDGAANGMVYKSTVSLLPISTAPASMQCTVTQRQTSTAFLGLQGDDYFPITQYGGNALQTQAPVLLSGRLQWEILSSSGQAPQKSGYLTASCPQDFHTDLHISLFDSTGKKIDESSLVPAVKGTSFEFLLDMRTGVRLGLSLVNDTAVDGQPYKLIARNQLNEIVSGPQFIYLHNYSQESIFADEAIQLPPNFVGSIEVIGVSSGNNYAVGLQFTGNVFSVVTPTVRNAPISGN